MCEKRARRASERERAKLEVRARDLDAKVSALESLSAAHEARYRSLRREADKLLSLLTAPVQPGFGHHDGIAVFPAGVLVA